jgi:endonuclease YncB( thermonuclease family)
MVMNAINLKGNKMIRISYINTIILIILLPNILFAWDGKTLSVTSGDEIKVFKDGKPVAIRLAAIDCPEKGQPYANAAKKFTANMVAGKVVIVWPTFTYRHGRMVAFVFVDNKSLNKELLSAGLAWHYKEYSRDPELAKLEFEARSKKVGLWSEPNPMPPWKWRKKQQSRYDR